MMPTMLNAPRANRRPVEAAMEPPVPPNAANRGRIVRSLVLSGRTTFRIVADHTLQTAPAAKLPPWRPMMLNLECGEPSARVRFRRLNRRRHRGASSSTASASSDSRRTVGSSGPSMSSWRHSATCRSNCCLISSRWRDSTSSNSVRSALSRA